MASPLAHPLGQATPEYSVRILSGRLTPLLLAGDRSHPEYDSAYRCLVHLAKVTGLGAETERRVEAGVKDLYSDLHFLPDGTPLRYRNATAAQMQAASKPFPRAPSGTEQANSALPFDRREGIPGARPVDAELA